MGIGALSSGNLGRSHKANPQVLGVTGCTQLAKPRVLGCCCPLGGREKSGIQKQAPDFPELPLSLSLWSEIAVIKGSHPYFSFYKRVN